ncbi:NAD-dependent epimerase/dehydratase family protein [Flavobacterium sp. UBA6135]|uniref:NAD-dependent epimerase/dehydratase family protein n=1 Tax=Flavobacterium sp. UBA6135 TaxID=1946553 RepID=UPI0025C72630|nr:NAD-dependent epimerase/dehydratase family protein [Flavobacterium sp. UBA6135]
MNLVTGGTGLVGAHLLLHLLQKGEKVRALYRNEKSIQKTIAFFKESDSLERFDEIDWIQGDITNIPSLEVAFKDIKYVYHCAALISFNSKDEELLRKTNIEGTSNMVNCALHFGVEKFCHVSSIAALGDPINGSYEIDENCEWNPEKHHSDYSISKYGAEMEVFRAQQEGLKTIIVNPGVILGSGFWEVGSGKIFKSVAKGNRFYTDGTSGFIAVEDVVALLFLLMKSEIQNERFALVSENITYKMLLDWIAEGMNKNKPTIKVGSMVTQIAWRFSFLLGLLGIKKFVITKDLAISLHNKSIYSNKKINEALSHDFIPIKAYCKSLASKYAIHHRVS